MKTLFKFSLFLFIIFLFGCTITKRKYTGGYYVNWHNNKIPVAKTCTEITCPEFVSRVSVPDLASNNQKTEKNINQKIAPTNTSYRNDALNYFHSEKATTKKRLNNSTFIYDIPTFTAATKNTNTVQKASENDNSKRDVRLSWLLCLLGFLSGLVLGIWVLIIVDFNPNQSIIGIGLVLFLPFALFIISLIHSFKAMKGGNHLGLTPIVVFDIIFLIIFFILIFLILAGFSI